MTATRTLPATALLATGLAGAALAQSSHGDMGKMPMGGSAAMHDQMQKTMADMQPAPGDAPSTKDFKEADMAMMHTMSVPYTGDTDVDFRTHMIPHHKGAIDMAKVALKHAKDASTKQMAQKIIDDQEKEIADMQAWLKQHGK
ncbi:CopM family metallochaperone [Methylobacterium sp. WSM2598]|uniref:CopM family metallochaperone n=1 Tax=Methylobacterium sp. WSM2598 TaxID=398261 RepID=UPI000375BED1|nr:DUF305 domain-containing protein [Methylobacterium sp. WSM2598]